MKLALISMQVAYIFMSVAHDQMVVGHTHESFGGSEMAAVATQYGIAIFLLNQRVTSPSHVGGFDLTFKRLWNIKSEISFGVLSVHNRRWLLRQCKCFVQGQTQHF